MQSGEESDHARAGLLVRSSKNSAGAIYAEAQEKPRKHAGMTSQSVVAENRFLGHDRTMPGPGYWLDPQNNWQDDCMAHRSLDSAIINKNSWQDDCMTSGGYDSMIGVIAIIPQITPEHNGTQEAASVYINSPIRPRFHFLPHQRYHLHKKRTSYETILFTDRRIPKSYSL